MHVCRQTSRLTSAIWRLRGLRRIHRYLRESTTTTAFGLDTYRRNEADQSPASNYPREGPQAGCREAIRAGSKKSPRRVEMPCRVARLME